MPTDLIGKFESVREFADLRAGRYMHEGTFLEDVLHLFCRLGFERVRVWDRLPNPSGRDGSADRRASSIAYH